MPSRARVQKITPPTPMPKAAVAPSLRERASAVRITITKLGPGLAAPMAIAPAMVTMARVGVITISSAARELLIGIGRVAKPVTHEVEGEHHDDDRHDR